MNKKTPTNLVPFSAASSTAQPHHEPLERSMLAFLQELFGKNRSKHTIRAYGSDLMQFLNWLRATNLVIQHPGQITRADISEYLSELSTQGMSGVTRARKLATIREYFRFLEA